MPDVLTLLDAIKRPRLLINAARIGLTDYRRDTHLPRHLGGDRPARSSDALRQLMILEKDMDDRRRANAADYSAARHVGLLIAMIAEARILRSCDRAAMAAAGQDHPAPAPVTYPVAFR